MTNNKGITLIALVITIIVLLILAGVSIAMLTGQNGILNQATNAKEQTSDAELADKINMALNTEYTNLMVDGHFSGYVAPTANEAVDLGTASAILSTNGLDDTIYSVSGIGTTATAGTSTGETILKISATGSTGEVFGTINKMEDGSYKIIKADYPNE